MRESPAHGESCLGHEERAGGLGVLTPGVLTPGILTLGILTLGAFALAAFPPGAFPPGAFPPEAFPPSAFPPCALASLLVIARRPTLAWRHTCWCCWRSP